MCYTSQYSHRIQRICLSTVASQPYPCSLDNIVEAYCFFIAYMAQTVHACPAMSNHIFIPPLATDLTNALNEFLEVIQCLPICYSYHAFMHKKSLWSRGYQTLHRICGLVAWSLSVRHCQQVPHTHHPCWRKSAIREMYLLLFIFRIASMHFVISLFIYCRTEH